MHRLHSLVVMITSDMWIEIQLPYKYYVYYELDV